MSLNALDRVLTWLQTVIEGLVPVLTWFTLQLGPWSPRPKPGLEAEVDDEYKPAPDSGFESRSKLGLTLNLSRAMDMESKRDLGLRFNFQIGTRMTALEE